MLQTRIQCQRWSGWPSLISLSLSPCFSGDSGKVTTVVATPGQGPDRPQEVSYTDIKVSEEDQDEGGGVQTSRAVRLRRLLDQGVKMRF